MTESSLPPARILGIETSCDETAAAVVEDGRRVLSSVVASQAKLHAKYGGVFPEVASRQHVRTIHTVVEEALQQAHLSLEDIDAIAVTQGPGLPGSLVVGINFAKGLALGGGKPLIGVNHLEGHIYSAWLDPAEGEPEPVFPMVALLVSGGHTELVLMTAHLTYERLGGTLDDAAGEAFDKVARLLGLGYPGGPAIQKAAEGGNPAAFAFPRSWLEGTFDFSFSGLKTAVLHQVRDLKRKALSPEAAAEVKDWGAVDTPLPTADLAASFQQAVVEVLATKARFAAQQHNAKELIVAGGVSANAALRALVTKDTPGRVHIPALKYCTDNAAMIAAAGYYRHALGQTTPEPLAMDALPNWAVGVIAQG
ncbi:MAG: tRNA (adenosine(37)-N6)-threonylcarbamoyltransferase complex transferase subunit TsaD [Anaerolineae bacterium]|nr:MAG: tRNA (adenosine(37)-N6)-threonylcarbamoyltransferase complex transferase subunit TsaD [Anaerolineae bacterium]